MNDSTRTWASRWSQALLEQHGTYFDSETRTIRPNFAEYVCCPACDSDSSRLLFEKDWFKYHECSSCSLVFMNPRLNNEATQQFYNSDVNEIYNETKFYDPSATEADDEINLSNLDFIAKYRKEGGNLLEVGCAMGFFLSKARERGYVPYGLELNKHTCEAARKLVGDTVYNIDLFDAKFSSGMFDVIYMRDVIEHIPNPKPFLDELNRIARPGAVIVLETHNIDGLIYKLVGKRHTVVFGFEHPVHWSPRSIGRALERSGFRPEAVGYASADFCVRDIIAYFGPATFTTILRPPISAVRRFLVRAICFALSVPGVRWLDRTITPMIANGLRRGSVMKVVARKTE